MPGGNILHFGGTQIRVVGSASMKLTFFGFDKILSQVIPPMVVTGLESREKFSLANFNSQRGLLRFETTGLGEFVKINNITIFVKPLFTQYPA